MLDDWRSPIYWRGVLAELLGTTLLHLVSYSSWQVLHLPVHQHLHQHEHLIQHQESTNLNSVQVLAIGSTYAAAYACLSWVFGRVSGGHLNTSISVACLLTRKISLHKTLLYITGTFIKLGSHYLRAEGMPS